MMTDETMVLILVTFLLTSVGAFFIGRTWGRVTEYQRWRRIWRAHHGEDTLTVEVYPTTGAAS